MTGEMAVDEKKKKLNFNALSLRWNFVIESQLIHIKFKHFLIRSRHKRRKIPINLVASIEKRWHNAIATVSKTL